MTDYLQTIERLKQQNMNPDLPQSQREANELRIQWLTWLNKEKPAKVETTFLDPIQGRLTTYGYSYTPASLLQG
ncbi:hypothetical protein V7054_26120 [Priestia megaterium]|uniref:hypothetical protein n=1 Tax=Priestia megaterium TaxID=1404 RepID=UPI003000915A